MVQRLALLAPRRMRQQRFKEMLPARLDMMLEKDDTMYLVYEARQRLEVSLPCCCAIDSASAIRVQSDPVTATPLLQQQRQYIQDVPL